MFTRSLNSLSLYIYMNLVNINLNKFAKTQAWCTNQSFNMCNRKSVNIAMPVGDLLGWSIFFYILVVCITIFHRRRLDHFLLYDQVLPWSMWVDFNNKRSSIDAKDLYKKSRLCSVFQQINGWTCFIKVWIPHWLHPISLFIRHEKLSGFH